MKLIPTDPDQIPAEFIEWMDKNNFAYYDCFERLIHLPTKKLYPFAEIYERLWKLLKRHQQLFKIPVDDYFADYGYLKDYKPPEPDYDHAAEQAADDNQRRMEEYYERQLDLNSR